MYTFLRPLVESLRRALEATGAAPVVRHRDIDRE